MKNGKLNILVIGKNGQLGHTFETVTKDSSDNYFYTSSSELDILDKNGILSYIKKNNIDVIINCSAYTNVSQAEITPDRAEEINAIGVGNIAEAAKTASVFLFHISTDYVYPGKGRKKNTYFIEDNEVNPFTKYGWSKLHGENAIENSGCSYIILRVSWLYSLYEKSRIVRCYDKLASHNHISCSVSKTGSLTYAKDLASAIVSIIEKRSFYNHEGVYNYANMGSSSVYDYFRYINDIQKMNVRITPFKEKELLYTAISSEKFIHTFGIPIRPWQDALDEMLSEYTQSVTLIKRIKHSIKKSVLKFQIRTNDK